MNTKAIKAWKIFVLAISNSNHILLSLITFNSAPSYYYSSVQFYYNYKLLSNKGIIYLLHPATGNKFSITVASSSSFNASWTLVQVMEVGEKIVFYLEALISSIEV